MNPQRHALKIATGLAFSLLPMMSQPPVRVDVGHSSAHVVIAAGTVTDSRGQPVSGASIVLDAWPKASVWPGNGNPPVGAHVPWTLIARTTTDAAGRYVISAASVRMLRAETGPDGIINLELTVFSPAGGTVLVFPRRLVVGSSGTYLAADTGMSTAPATPQMPPLQLRATKAAASATPQCTPVTIFLKKYKKKWTTVGGTYSRRKGVQQTFEYIKGQNTNISIATSATGANGTWGASSGGTSSFSATATVTYPSFNGPKSVTYQTEITPAKYVTTCSGTYTIFPYKWDGGALSPETSTPRATHCTFYEKGSSFTDDTTTAGTFGDGMTILGVNLGTQTGWDTEAVIGYKFFGAGMDLCGVHDVPPGDPRWVVAGRP